MTMIQILQIRMDSAEMTESLRFAPKLEWCPKFLKSDPLEGASDVTRGTERARDHPIRRMF